MKQLNTSITFTCPRCKEPFEFDFVREYEFVPCPMCGAGFMTVRKGQTLLLESFRFTPTSPIQNPVPIMI